MIMNFIYITVEKNNVLYSRSDESKTQTLFCLAAALSPTLKLCCHNTTVTTACVHIRKSVLLPPHPPAGSVSDPLGQHVIIVTSCCAVLDEFIFSKQG